MALWEGLQQAVLAPEGVGVDSLTSIEGWLMPASDSYRRAASLLWVGGPVQQAILSGLTASLGGLGEGNVRAAATALTQALRSQDPRVPACKAAIVSRLVQMLEDSQPATNAAAAMTVTSSSNNKSKKSELGRLGIPTLRTMDRLLQEGLLQDLSPAEWIGSWAGMVRRILRGCQQPAALQAGASVYAQLSLLPALPLPQRQSLLASTTMLTGHGYPSVRRAAGEAIYLALLALGPEQLEISEDDFDLLLTLSMTTPWDSDNKAAALEAREQLLQVAKLPRPVMVKTGKAKADSENKLADHGNYGDLVREAGY